MTDRYFTPFGHLQGGERANAIFTEDQHKRGKDMIDPEGRRWRILHESSWKNLHCPTSDQAREGVVCRYVGICDVIMARKQVQETTIDTWQYLGGVVGDKLSAQYLKIRCSDVPTGKGLCSYLKNHPVTTRHEYALKLDANASHSSSANLDDMTGCTSHKISNYKVVVGDYEDTTQSVDVYKWAQFEELTNYLRCIGPIYVAMVSVDKKTPLLGIRGRYYRRTSSDQVKSTKHGVMAVGYGQCENMVTGEKEDYFVIQNTWGEKKTKYGRMSNNVLSYAIEIEP